MFGWVLTYASVTKKPGKRSELTTEIITSSRSKQFIALGSWRIENCCKTISNRWCHLQGSCKIFLGQFQSFSLTFHGTFHYKKSLIMSKCNFSRTCLISTERFLGNLRYHFGLNRPWTRSSIFLKKESTIKWTKQYILVFWKCFLQNAMKRYWLKSQKL